MIKKLSVGLVFVPISFMVGAYVGAYSSGEDDSLGIKTAESITLVAPTVLRGIGNSLEYSIRSFIKNDQDLNSVVEVEINDKKCYFYRVGENGLEEISDSFVKDFLENEHVYKPVQTATKHVATVSIATMAGYYVGKTLNNLGNM
ncbi:MAG: hypothetical protein ACMXX7_02350 [Candidatus Woesearchaeota archaeon]